MKRLLLFVLLTIMCGTHVFAQKPRQSFAQMLQATSLNFPLPTPQVIITDPENDLWPAQTQTPPPSVPGTPTPTDTTVRIRPILDLLTASSKSNGVDTVYVLNFSSRSEVRKVQGEICLDTDQNPGTGFEWRRESGDRMFKPGIGCDATVSMYNFPNSGSTNIYSRFTGSNVQVPAQVVGQSLVMVIPNDAIGEFLDGKMDSAIVIDDGYGPIDVAPNSGYGTITSIRNLSISPDSSTLLTSQTFDIGIIVETDSPQTSFRKIVLYDGQDVTTGFEDSEIVGDLPISLPFQTPRGPVRFRPGTTIRYKVPAGSMSPGRHTVGVILIGADGIAGQQVEYLVLSTSDTGK